MSTCTAAGGVSELLALAKRQPQVVGSDESMSVVRCRMEQHGISHVPVVESSRVVGMISDRDLLRCPWSHADGDTRMASPETPPPLVRYWMSADPVTLTAQDNLQIAARKMLEHRISGLPILSDDGQLFAIVTERDLVWHVARRRPTDDDESFCPVVDHMSHNVVAVSPSSTLHHAILTLTERPIRHLPVLDGQNVVGMLSDRDVLRYLSQAVANGRSAFETANDEVALAMNTPPRTVEHLFTILQAAQLMRQHNIRALPVLQSGRLIGIFTTTDVLKFTAGRTARTPH